MAPVANDGYEHHGRVILFWVVLFFVLIVSSVNLYLVEKVNNNSKIGQDTTCTLVKFLSGSIVSQRNAIRKQPDSPLNPQRRLGVIVTIKLRKDLLSNGVSCK